MMTSWETRSINFSNAFVQAKLKEPIWIHLPRGFWTAGPAKTCLRLIHSQYGISQAPQLWYENLLKALLDLGLKQCQHDQCLFYKMNLLIVLYVDDAGIAAPETKYIDEFISSLETKGFTLTKEGTFSEFLGIKFTENKDAGTISLTQKGLIKKIISTTNMENCKPNWTPAATSALGMDPNGKLMTEEWSYPSTGMLLYLSMNTSAIAFAVSQVACFSYSPKQSHATSKLFATCLVLGTRERLSSQLTLYSLIVMSMQILQVFTNVILIPALQVASLASALLFLLAEYLLCGTHSFSQKFPSVLLRVNIQVCCRLCIPFCQSAHFCLKWHQQSDLRRHLLPLFMQGSSRTTMELICWLRTNVLPIAQSSTLSSGTSSGMHL
jgi:hypothetical protein